MVPRDRNAPTNSDEERKPEDLRPCGAPLRDFLVHNKENLRNNFKMAMELVEKVCCRVLPVLFRP